MAKRLMIPNETPILFYTPGMCSLGALISLVWLDQPFRVCRLREGESDTPEYLRLNPLGQVPMLFKKGKLLTQNVAVLHQIADWDPGHRLAFESRTPEAARLNSVLGFLASDFHKSFEGTFLGDHFHPDKKVQAEIKKTVVEGHLREMLVHIDQRLLGKKYFFETPTIVDAYFFAMARWADDLYDVGKEFPNIKHFQKVMGKDPRVKFALEVESGKRKSAHGSFLGSMDFKTFLKGGTGREDSGFVPGLAAKKKNTGEIVDAAKG